VHLLQQLLEAWRTNNRITLFLIDNISDAGMLCTLSKRGGRDVARQFAHIHNVRVWHLENRAKDLAEGLVKFETKVTPGRTELKRALSASGRAVETFLEDNLAGKPKRRGFKKGIFTTLGYFIAHESHHRGSILLTLKQCGHKPEKKVQDSIWGWDQM
jgi:uncharacterized damage-inducible protein DinB